MLCRGGREDSGGLQSSLRGTVGGEQETQVRSPASRIGPRRKPKAPGPTPTPVSEPDQGPPVEEPAGNLSEKTLEQLDVNEIIQLLTYPNAAQIFSEYYDSIFNNKFDNNDLFNKFVFIIDIHNLINFDFWISQ